MEQDQLDKQKLAQAKLAAKRARVRDIRRKVAVLAASLAVAFSGVILTRTAVQEFSGEGQQQVSATTDQATTNPEQPGTAETIGATVASVATGLVLGEDDDDEEEEEGGGIGSVFNSSSSQSTESYQS